MAVSRKPDMIEMCSKAAAKYDGYPPDFIENNGQPIWRRYEHLVLAILTARMSYLSEKAP